MLIRWWQNTWVVLVPPTTYTQSLTKICHRVLIWERRFTFWCWRDLASIHTDSITNENWSFQHSWQPTIMFWSITQEPFGQLKFQCYILYDIPAEGIYVSFPWRLKKKKKKGQKWPFFFKWVPFNFKICFCFVFFCFTKTENNDILQNIIIWTRNKKHNFASDNYIFLKQRKTEQDVGVMPFLHA